MAGDIKPTRREQPQKKISGESEYIELQDLKPTKTTSAAKKAKDILHPTISEHPKEERKKAQPLEGNKPTLPIPITLDKNEVDQIRTNLEHKFTEPVTYNEIIQRISVGSEDIQTRIKKATDEINKVLKSGLSYEAKTLQIIGLILKATGISQDIIGEHAKDIGRQQAEEQKERFDLILKQQDVDRKAATTSKISKAFGWIGDIINFIFAVTAVVATYIAAVGTAGASSIAVAGAVAWLSGAILGMVARVVNESGVLKGNLAHLGTAMTFLALGLSLGGVVATGGFTALKAGDPAIVMAVNALVRFEKTMAVLKVVGDTTVTVAGAVYKSQIADLEAKKVDKEKIHNQLTFTFNNVIHDQKAVLKALESRSNEMSEQIARSSRTISAILGNI